MVKNNDCTHNDCVMMAHYYLNCSEVAFNELIYTFYRQSVEY